MNRWTSEIAQQYAALGEQAHVAMLAPHIPALLGDVAGRRVLDFGCGPGRFAWLFAEMGAAEVLGVDQSDVMIDTARQIKHAAGAATNDSPVRFEVGDETRLPIDGAFDAVWCSLALMMCSDEAQLRGAIAGLVQSLTGGGRLGIVLTHPCFRDCRYSTFHYETPPDYSYWSGGAEYRVVLTPHGGPTAEIVDHHWPLATYLNAVIDAGADVQCVMEMPAEVDAQGRPIGDPAYLAIGARRASSRSTP